MAKEALTGAGLEPETSGSTHPRLSYLGYPGLWMLAIKKSLTTKEEMKMPRLHASSSGDGCAVVFKQMAAVAVASVNSAVNTADDASTP